MSEPPDRDGSKRFVEAGDVIHSADCQRLLREIRVRRKRRKAAVRGYNLGVLRTWVALPECLCWLQRQGTHHQVGW